MDYTKNYHLPQWKKEDRIMMEDFNQMCADLETGLTRAQSAADSAQQTADTASILPYAVGSYTGTGSTQTITLGFRPRFLIISGLQDEVSVIDIEEFGLCCVITAGNSLCRRVQFTNTGFVVNAKEYYTYPDLTLSGRVYDYIAFR